MNRLAAGCSRALWQSGHIRRSLAVVLLAFLSGCVCAESRGVVADILLTQTMPKSAITDDNPLEEHTAGEFAQDVMGRTRVEWDGQITISDPVDGVYWRVDVRKGVAFRSESQPARSDPPPARKPQSLGSRIINGIECEGLRWTHEVPTALMGNAAPINIVTETWTTRAFGAPLEVLTVTRDPHNGVHEQKLLNIREIDFPAGAFRPNPRFRVVEEHQ